MISRRLFLESAVAVAAAAQTKTELPWGQPVLDIHLHLRNTVDGNFAHIDGCGVQRAVILTGASAADRVKAIQAKYPGRFEWAASSDITKPEAAELLRTAVKNGARGLAEIKFHVAADGPELQRMYALAAELNIPILVHFQEVEHFAGEGMFSTGVKKLGAMLKAYPKTTFIGHADAFWANVSSDYAEQAAYPTGPVKRGGMTDKLLSDYPNLYGDLSANSGNNAMSRDPEFTAGFLERHQNKLMFGSDCGCSDGHGSGTGQPNNPAANRLAGKCVARETLTLLKKSTKPEVFRKLVWQNGHRIFKIDPKLA